MATKKEETKTKLDLPVLKTSRLEIHIKGTSSLIVHRFAEKARKEIEAKQGGAARMKKAARDPVDDFNAARYIIDDEDCFSAAAIKGAMMNAAQFADLYKTTTGMSLFVIGDAGGGDFIVIRDKKGRAMKPTMRTDIVRIGGMTKTSTPTYRPEYRDWFASFIVEYNDVTTTPSQILNLVRLAGFHVGLCEHRPQKGGGGHGRFELDEAKLNREAAE